MKRFYTKSVSEIYDEASDTLYGKTFIFGVITLIIYIVQSILNPIPFISVIIAPIVSFIFTNLSLLVIDDKKINTSNFLTGNFRGGHVIIGGLVLNIGLIVITLLLLAPIVMLSNMTDESVLHLIDSIDNGNILTILPNVILIRFGVLWFAIIAVGIFIYYLMIRVSFFYYIICDNNLSASDAIDISFEITKNNVLRLALFYLYFAVALISPLILLHLISLYLQIRYIYLIFFLLFLAFYAFVLIPTFYVAKANLYREIAS